MGRKKYSEDSERWLHLEYIRQAIALKSDQCILWPFYMYSTGYGQVLFRGKYQTASRVALILHTGVDENGMHATHGPCHCRACINPKHLSWSTPAGNAADKSRDGTILRGEKHPRAKLSYEDVVDIYCSNEPHRAIAASYGISKTNVGHIKRGDSWSWLTRNLTPSTPEN